MVPPQLKAPPFISPLKHVPRTHCGLCPLCAASKGPRREEHLVYKMRGEADEGVGCPRLSKNWQSLLGSPKAKRRTVEPNMIPSILPSFPNVAPSPLLNAPPPAPLNTYLVSEARGALESCCGAGLPGTFPRGSFWSPGSHSVILRQDASVHSQCSVHTLETLVKRPPISHAEVQSLPQSSHEAPACAWGCQALSYLHALRP